MEHLAACAEAIQKGDTQALARLLAENPSLVTARLTRNGGAYSLLHVATDWPGHFPNVRASIETLIAHGADVNVCFQGRHTETPLHWAASSDDVAALDALLDHGADIEAPGAVIGGGTPLADAAAFGCWNAARRLIERGAQANLWQAAALGLIDRVEQFFAAATPPEASDITGAFWCACHGNQRQAAEFLLHRSADVNWIGWDHLPPLDAAERSGAVELAEWLRSQGARSATAIG